MWEEIREEFADKGSFCEFIDATDDVIGLTVCYIGGI